VQPQFCCGRGDFASNESGANHHDALRCLEPRTEHLAFVQRSQIPDPVIIRIRNVNPAIPGPSRKNKVVVVQPTRRRKLDSMTLPVNRNNMLCDKIDPLVLKEFLGSERDRKRVT